MNPSQVGDYTLLVQLEGNSLQALDAVRTADKRLAQLAKLLLVASKKSIALGKSQRLRGLGSLLVAGDGPLQGCAYIQPAAARPADSVIAADPEGHGFWGIRDTYITASHLLQVIKRAWPSTYKGLLPPNLRNTLPDESRLVRTPGARAALLAVIEPATLAALQAGPEAARTAAAMEVATQLELDLQLFVARVALQPGGPKMAY